MGCRLDKYTTYPLVTVTKDVSEGRLVARLESPPTSCPDGVFTTKNGSTRVVSGATPVLQYTHGKALVTVPNKEFIREVNVPETNFGTVLFWTLAFGTIGYLVYRLIKNSNETTVAYEAPTAMGWTSPSRTYTPGGNVATPPTTPAPGTTVINNNSGGNNGFVEGMLLNEMLRDYSTHTTEIIHEHDSNTFQSDEDTTVETDSDTSYGSDNSGSSFSSDDSGSSYSSDDSSSSSDSSWSSSDSSSDWGSSDSGSSFDSGGGSFDS